MTAFRASALLLTAVWLALALVLGIPASWVAFIRFANKRSKYADLGGGEPMATRT